MEAVGVMYFLTARLWGGLEVSDAHTEENREVELRYRFAIPADPAWFHDAR